VATSLGPGSAVPEVDRAAWIDLADARSKIHKGQVALLDEVNSKLGG